MRRTLRAIRARWCKTTALVLVVIMLASCATVPGKPDTPLFPSFNSCVAWNLAGAALGGAVLGVVIAKLFKRPGAGAGSGAVVAAVISVAAWHECAKVHSTTTVKTQRTREELVAAGQMIPEPGSTLAFQGLDAQVDREAKAVNFDLAFVFIADSPDAKDIPVTIQHRLDIAQMVREGDRLVLADANGNPLLDVNRRPIPVKDFASLPEGRIVYQTFYDKTDKEIIQQGSRKISHELPAAVKGMQYPLPMRYTVSVDAGRFTGQQTIEFYLPDVSDRPKAFSPKNDAVVTAKSGPPPAALMPAAGPAAPAASTIASQAAAVDSGPPPAAPAPPPPPPASSREVAPGTQVATVAQYVTQKVVVLYESAGGPKPVAQVQPNTLLQVLETSTLASGRDESVEAVQQALKDKGHDPGQIDGVMGARTSQALRDFQKAEDLKVTGRLDDQTREKLGVQAAQSAGRPAVWLKVSSRQGVVGWVRKADVVEVK